MDRFTTSRRSFLENLAAGGVAAGALASLETARGYSANDTLTCRLAWEPAAAVST